MPGACMLAQTKAVSALWNATLQLHHLLSIVQLISRQTGTVHELHSCSNGLHGTDHCNALAWRRASSDSGCSNLVLKKHVFVQVLEETVALADAQRESELERQRRELAAAAAEASARERTERLQELDQACTRCHTDTAKIGSACHMAFTLCLQTCAVRPGMLFLTVLFTRCHTASSYTSVYLACEVVTLRSLRNEDRWLLRGALSRHGVVIMGKSVVSPHARRCA